jgi:N-methylhydantoinase A
MSVVIGVDVGGTFTDFFVLDTATEHTWVHKTPSTPKNPSQAIATGLEEILGWRHFDVGDVSRLAHGTTVATNTLIQRKGATVALFVTEGFRDLLEIGRQTRPHLYSIQIDAPDPLVPRERRLQVRERLYSDGSVKLELDDDQVKSAIRDAVGTGADAYAVCFLFSFLNPEHERRVKDLLTESGCLAVSVSHEVQPEMREYERMSTTVLNAYLIPLMGTYLTSLEKQTRESVPKAALRINQSSGGLMSATQAARFPIRTALSGPAAGAVGAAAIARGAGRPNAITLDMGGTSADVCLIRDGKFASSYEGNVGGFPVRLPMVDVNAVGAGGGSITWIDRDGLVKVGPMSAGAYPGPACYGLGGAEPTVTDANLILGRLDLAGLLDGRLPLDLAKARAAFGGIANTVGVSVEQAALGAVDIVVANMVRAIRAVSIERGHDPRRFSLLAFGGGGPLHGRAVAASLGIREVVIPPYPGILCAQGLLAADLTEDFVATTRLQVSSASHQNLIAAFTRLKSSADQWYEEEGAPLGERTLSVSLDMRYIGQNYELSVPADPSLFSTGNPELVADTLAKAFHAAHQRQYGTNNPSAAVEILNLRVRAGVPARISIVREEALGEPRPLGQAMLRDVWFDRSGPISCAIYRRNELLPGTSFRGPAIIEQLDATTVVFPGDKASVDACSNLLIEVAA